MIVRVSERTKKWLALVVLAALLVGALLLIGVIQGPRPPTSYSDGYRWGYTNAGVRIAPACTRAEMASDNQVRDPNLRSVRPTGDGRPHDRFARWRAGCEAGAKAELHSQ